MNEYERGITLYSVQQEIFLSFFDGSQWNVVAKPFGGAQPGFTHALWQIRRNKKR